MRSTTSSDAKTPDRQGAAVISSFGLMSVLLGPKKGKKGATPFRHSCSDSGVLGIGSSFSTPPSVSPLRTCSPPVISAFRASPPSTYLASATPSSKESDPARKSGQHPPSTRAPPRCPPAVGQTNPTIIVQALSGARLRRAHGALNCRPHRRAFGRRLRVRPRPAVVSVSPLA